uniref:Myosin-binding protein C, fast-type n=1 Tax=Macaca nemestrina TaxID=9545 RepID=A0A2K6D775_MACNE
MPEAKPAAKKAPKGKDAPKEAPKQAAPKEAPAEAPKEAPPEDQSPTVEEPTGIFLKKPDSVSVETGKDTVIVAKVNGKELPGKPTIRWFKGKWLELGSKSGARFSFKESHDSASNVYTVELHIGKVVLGDRGDYRLEVKAKDTCDSCGFNIDVEAPRQDASGQSLESFKRMGEGKSDTAGELDFSGLLKKREVVEEEKKKKKKDDDDLGIPPEIWELLKGAKKSEYEKIAFQYGITDLRGMLKRLKKAKVEVKKSAAEQAVFKCEVSDEKVTGKWYKNGIEVRLLLRYVFENVGKKRILTINKLAVKDEKVFTELFVKEPPVLIYHTSRGPAVEVSEEGAQVMCGVELTREDSFQARYRFKKDGKHVDQDDRVHYQVMTNGASVSVQLIVEGTGLRSGSEAYCAANQAVFSVRWSDENRTEVTHSQCSSEVWWQKWLGARGVRMRETTTFVHDGYALSPFPVQAQLPGPRISSVPPEPPKIHLDCSGKTSENAIVVVAGNKLRLDVSITGEPPPVATWLKGDEVFTTTEGRVRIEKRADSSSFVIESAERTDEGRYTIKVTNPVGEDVASIFLRVVDVPDPPEAVRITSVGEDWAILVWEPPKYDGGKPVTGYLLERKKKGSQRWMKLNFEVFTETTYESTKMIEGILYEMRVFAVNAIGVSQPSMNTKPFMPIAPTSEPLHLIVEDVTDTTTTLKWRPPNRIGAGGIDGYLVEYCLEGSDEWVSANTEPVERCGFTVKNLPTGARILFRVVGVNIAGRSEPATLAQPVTIREIAEPPKIRLPRHLRQTYIRKVGEQLNLVIPFQGKPRPQVVWTKGGAPVDTSRVHVRTSDFDTVFFVRQAARSDSGEYELSVQIENMKDTATIHIRVVEKAGPPINVMVKEVWGTNALVEWQAPKDDGNSEITGYFVQKADKKTMEWFNVYERNRHTSCTVSDLIVGNEYYFRVYTENICGLSDSPGVSKNTARILKTGITLKPFEYKEHDFRMAPKFLTPLIDRVVVAGYSAALNCAVRGHPKPKVVWMKNKMEIREDPKFLMNNYQGVLTLNIRRPSPFDAGTYTCLAVNELGEALAECKLEVRGEGVAVPNTG